MEDLKSHRFSPIQANEIRRALFLPIIALNLILSIGHYVDNVVHFSNYAEPVWLHAHSVDMFWFILVAWLIPLAWSAKKQNTKSPIVSFASFTYVLLTGLTLLHYHYGSMSDFTPKINFLILSQVAGSFLFLPYVFHAGRKLRPPTWAFALTLITLVPLFGMLRHTIVHGEIKVTTEIVLMILAIIIWFLRCFRVVPISQ